MIKALRRPTGFVLVINLIILLILAIAVSSMYKNSLLQQQMSVQFKVQQIAKQHANSSISQAKIKIKLMLQAKQNLAVQFEGFYPSSDMIKTNKFNWSDANASFQSKQGSYIIQHIGIAKKVSGKNLGVEHHLFFIYSRAKSVKGGSYIQQELFTIDPLSI